MDTWFLALNPWYDCPHWQGSWIVRQAVGSKAVPLGQIVEASYYVGFNYMEVNINYPDICLQVFRLFQILRSAIHIAIFFID